MEVFTFKQNLSDMPAIDGIEKILLYALNGELVGEIPNADGKRGSLQVYNYILGGKDGTIGRIEARNAIAQFAEHSEDAYRNPGKHPNIDRLFAVIQTSKPLVAEIFYKK